MEFKTMTLEELRKIDPTTLDEVEFDDYVIQAKKLSSENKDTLNTKRLADTLADSERMKVANESKARALVSKRSKDIKVSFILKVDGKIENWTYGSAIRGAVAANTFIGVTFTIDGQTDIIFTSDSDLNWGEFNTTDLVKLAYAKRVVAYFGYAARKTEFRKDGVTKTSEASATEVIKALSEDEMERVAVIKDGESIALADFLASLE